MLGLFGLRIFEATAANIADLGEQHGHRVLRVCGKGTKVVLIPLPPAACRRASHRPGHRRPYQRVDPAQQPWRQDGPPTPPPAACGGWPRPLQCR
jgi:integrase